MSSGLIFKRLFAVSFVLLFLFVWGCEDDSSDLDSGPKTLIDLDMRKLESPEKIEGPGQFEFFIDSFIKDEHIVLQDSELATEQLADFWADVAVRWGLRQKMANSEATGEADEGVAAEASASEDSPETSGEISETFWLQRSANYSDADDVSEYKITAAEGEKQFFVLDPQDWKDNLPDHFPAEWSDISAGELEVVVEAFLATQAAEGQFTSTASIDLPADFQLRQENTEVASEASTPANSQPTEDTISTELGPPLVVSWDEGRTDVSVNPEEVERLWTREQDETLIKQFAVTVDYAGSPAELKFKWFINDVELPDKNDSIATIELRQTALGYKSIDPESGYPYTAEELATTEHRRKISVIVSDPQGNSGEAKLFVDLDSKPVAYIVSSPDKFKIGQKNAQAVRVFVADENEDPVSMKWERSVDGGESFQDVNIEIEAEVGAVSTIWIDRTGRKVGDHLIYRITPISEVQFGSQIEIVEGEPVTTTGIDFY